MRIKNKLYLYIKLIPYSTIIVSLWQIINLFIYILYECYYN